MPFYGSIAFGVNVVCRVRDTPSERQENAYAGLTGVESIPLGGRGRYIEVSGKLCAISRPALKVLDTVFRSYRDDTARPFTEDDGYVWPLVILEEFNPEDRVCIDVSGFYRYYHEYRARFRSLT